MGLRSSRQLSLWEPACLRSYESVQKKDRRQQMHQLIAQRFWLWACREVGECSALPALSGRTQFLSLLLFLLYVNA